MSEQYPAAGAGPVPAPAAPSPGTHPAVRPRLATPDDVPEILRLIGELAEYERARHEVVATQQLLADLLFGTCTGPLPGPVAACHVIEADAPADTDTTAPANPAPPAPALAAMALWFRNASTWLSVPGIYLEDLYVSPHYRGRGYGRALLTTLAAVCVEQGYGRLEWSVLDWNVDAIGFYRALGAEPMDEWTVHRLTGPALSALAGGSVPATRVDPEPARRFG